ncbi:MAG: GNAT family protein [Nitrospirales bacterium]
MTHIEDISEHLRFRPAVEEDYPAIGGLVTSQEELFFVYPRGHYPLDVEQIRILARERQELTVAIVKGKVVGFTNLYDMEAKRQAFIGNVIIEKMVRGSGIGRKMIGVMLESCFEKYRLSKVNISVFSHNIPALVLYSRLGFTPFELEERQDFAGRKTVMIHMTLIRKMYEDGENNKGHGR